MRNPEFIDIYKNNATEAKKIYNTLKNNAQYASLPTWSSHETAKNDLNEWEKAHPDSCKIMDDEGRFFGFNGADPGNLKKFVQFLYIPSIIDPVTGLNDDARSMLSQLLDRAVRGKLANNLRYIKFQRTIKEEYKKTIQKDIEEDISALKSELQGTLQSFIPYSEIMLKQEEPDLAINPPRVQASLKEDNYMAPVDKIGSGLQRFFMMTILQHLEAIQSDATNNSQTQNTRNTEPTLILMIDEPELHQHPTRLRHIANTLQSLSRHDGQNTLLKTQVMYNTHSPHLVSIGRLNQVRLLRKIPNPSKPNITKIYRTNIEDVAAAMGKTNAKSIEKINNKLKKFMSPLINEGFFASAVVLVEGVSDRAAILTVSQKLGIDLDQLNIPVIPCNGKDELEKPATIFSMLKIPIYIMWDGDGNKTDESRKINRKLLTIVGEPKDATPPIINKTCAYFEENREKATQKDIGEVQLEKYQNLCQNEIHTTNEKDEEFVACVIENIYMNGGSLPTLECIVKHIQDINSNGQTTQMH